jgi:pyridoxal phosphate enzyme (YggS family)
MTSPEERLQDVRRRIDEACGRSGRDPASVTLVAVAKTFPAERVREMLACGQTVFGESRVQEALEKIPAVGEGARWHLVGHLQRNKARHAVGTFELIHSVDGEPLARELDRRAAATGVRQSILLQVNVSDEASKHGVPVGDAEALLAVVSRLEHLEPRGLMTIPPWSEDPEASRPWLTRLRALRDRLRERSGLALPDLSMGMTGDFEVAVEEGATLVRIGTALFGERLQG